MRAQYVLMSDVEWCDRRYELFTDQPKADSYAFDCPWCGKNHRFVVLERTHND